MLPGNVQALILSGLLDNKFESRRHSAEVGPSIAPEADLDFVPDPLAPVRAITPKT